MSMKARKYALLNDISPLGIQEFGENFELTKDVNEADLWLVRSAELKDAELPDRLRVIARAGAGVNNIPLVRCAQKGIVVFNTPGGNANAVAELVVAGMLLASRGIIEGINWLRTQPADEKLQQAAEKQKKIYSGHEIRGKRLVVVGLGAVGHLVANAAVALGMEVTGYDPMMSIEYALKLSRSVHVAKQLNGILADADFVSLNLPLNDKTKGLFDEAMISRMKPGAVLLNFARDLIVDEEALGKALQSGAIRGYVTDFANEKVMNFPNTIVLPHLGAATEESEDNCAVMAVLEAQDYLNNGNITNSVNFPAINLGKAVFPTRVMVLHNNVPGILSKVTTLFGEAHVNIEQMVSASRGDFACALFDTSVMVQREFAMQLSTMPGILKVRVIHSAEETV